MEMVCTQIWSQTFLFCLVRNGLNLKQAEWNILQMGTTKYESKCKQIRFKNVYLETTNLSVQKTIPLMTDQVIDVRNKYHRNVNIGRSQIRVIHLNNDWYIIIKSFLNTKLYEIVFLYKRLLYCFIIRIYMCRFVTVCQSSL